MDSLFSSTNNRNILEETDEKFYFPPGSLRYDQDNIITILQVSCILWFTNVFTAWLGQHGPERERRCDHHHWLSGLANRATDAHVNEEKSPRGVRGFMLNTGDFGEWKVQGKIGGYSKFVPRLRTRGIPF